MLEVKWVDFVFLAECRCYGPHFSIETWPRVEVSPAAFASENFSGRCGWPTIAAGTRLPCACCREHRVTPPRRVPEPHGTLWGNSEHSRRGWGRCSCPVLAAQPQLR